jgi:hypothetical protein
LEKDPQGRPHSIVTDGVPPIPELSPSDAVVEAGVKFAAALVNGELLNPV